MTATALLLAGTALAYATSQSPDTEQEHPTFLASTKGTAAIFVTLVAMVLCAAFVAYRACRAHVLQTRAATPKVPASSDPELGDAKAQSPSPSTAPTEVGSPDVGAMLEGKQLSKAISTASTASGW